MSVIVGRRVDVRCQHVTFTGKCLGIDCFGVTLLDPVPGNTAVMMIPLGRIEYVEVVDLPRGIGSAA